VSGAGENTKREGSSFFIWYRKGKKTVIITENVEKRSKGGGGELVPNEEIFKRIFGNSMG